MKNKLLHILNLLFIGNSLFAQNSTTLSINGDLVSRYVWRGSDIGNTPAIQPSVTLAVSSLKVGVWGSYPLNTESKATDEFDMWASYSFESEIGNISAIITDYYFPSAGIPFGNYNNYNSKNGSGGHILELGISYSGKENFPLSLSGYMNIHNEEGNNIYLELGYSTKISDTDLTLIFGATTGNKKNPVYYGSDSFAVINAGFKFVKTLHCTEKLSLPVSLAVIFNLKKEIAYVVMGISI